MNQVEYKLVEGNDTDFIKLCQELDQEYIDLYGDFVADPICVCLQKTL